MGSTDTDPLILIGIAAILLVILIVIAALRD